MSQNENQKITVENIKEQVDDAVERFKDALDAYFLKQEEYHTKKLQEPANDFSDKSQIQDDYNAAKTDNMLHTRSCIENSNVSRTEIDILESIEKLKI